MALAACEVAMSHSSTTGLSRIRAEAGLTLPELTIIMVIMAMGTVLATPVYLDWAARADLRQGATELASTLNYARFSAMNRNQMVQVTLALVAGRVQITTNGLGTTRLGSAVNGFTGGPVRFTSQGLRFQGGAGDQLITLSNRRGQTYSVRVTPAGKSDWCPQATCP